MSNGATSPDGFRVVIFSRDAALTGAALAEACPERVRYVHFSSAYEAAAEILVGSADALVLDLRSLSGRSLRLLEVARQSNVEILGIGAVPAGIDADQLSGLRLVALHDLPAALGKLSAPPAGALEGVRLAPAKAAPPVEAPQRPPEAPPETTGQWVGREQPASDERAAAATPPGKPAPPPTEPTGQEPEPSRDMPVLQNILTAEELAALLENEL